MGPTAALTQWVKPVTRAGSRVCAIADAGIAAGLASLTYNSKVASMYMYKSSMVPLPAGIKRDEMSA
eukprot:5695578-Karenia_brevis.AAC.1